MAQFGGEEYITACTGLLKLGIFVMSWELNQKRYFTFSKDRFGNGKKEGKVGNFKV